MHKTLIPTLFAFAVSAMPLAGQDEAKPKPQPHPIKVEMKKFDAALDDVSDYLEKPGDKLPMQHVAAAQAALQACKVHAPRTTEQQPKERREEFVRNYRLAINKLLRAALDLEDALLQKDYEAAEKAVDDMLAQRRQGHRTYKGRRRRR